MVMVIFEDDSPAVEKNTFESDAIAVLKYDKEHISTIKDRLHGGQQEFSMRKVASVLNEFVS